MISRADFIAYGDANRYLANQAISTTQNYFQSLDYANPASRNALHQFLLAVNNYYCMAVAQNAAEFFATQTGYASLPVTEIVGNAILGKAGRKALAALVAFALATAVAGKVAQATKAVTDKVAVNMKVATAAVMGENSERYGVKYARVPRGDKTCEFCTMLASRGFAYHSKESAGGGMGHGGYWDSFHSYCDCEIVCDKDGEVEGYDPDIFADEYYEARDIVEHGSHDRWESLSKSEQEYYGSESEFLTKSTLAQMRALRSGNWDGEPVMPQINRA